MEDSTNQIRGRARHRPVPIRLRPRRGAQATAGLIGLMLLAAACSSAPAAPGVANVSATNAATGSSPSGGSTKPNPLAFAQCMRSHGVADFPDPSSQGQISIQGGQGSDLDPNNPRFQAAQKACGYLQPKPSAAQQKQFQQDALKFSECMRSHGLKNFPDPSSGGLRISIKSGQGSDLDPNNPTFQAAQQACQHLLPGANGGGLRVNAGGPQHGGNGPSVVRGSSGASSGSASG
jgi:hypothetical protein